MADRPTEPIPPGGGWGQPPEQGRRSAGAPPPPRSPRPPGYLPWWRRAWGAGLIWGWSGSWLGHDGYLCRWGKGYAVAKDSYLLNHGSS
jgi:hypothetical protein